MIWCGSYRMKSAKKGIQNGQLELCVADVFSVGMTEKKEKKKSRKERTKEKNKIKR